jgi:hypothetical protein
VLADPTSALFCAWQAGVREGAQLVNEPGAWSMSALQTTDPARAAAFYGAVFGWDAEAFGPVSLLRLPGYVGGTSDQPVPRDVVAVMAPLSDADAASRWDVDFWVHDGRAGRGDRALPGDAAGAAPADTLIGARAGVQSGPRPRGMRPPVDDRGASFECCHSALSSVRMLTPWRFASSRHASR